MKKRFHPSFRSRLFAGFLAASLLPLLLCSALLLQVFRFQLNERAETENREYLQHAASLLENLHTSFGRISAALQASPYVAPALRQGRTDSAFVYDALFSATEGSRQFARFDLYDRDGRRLYSTRSGGAPERLSADWGILYAAGSASGLVFTAAEEAGETALRAASLLTTDGGDAAGYLLITAGHADLQSLLEGSYGSSGALLLLNRYWRPIYASQASLASLAPLLRRQLLQGETLGGSAGELSYTADYLPDMGLYLLLQRPRAFPPHIQTLLSTVTLGCALVCVAVSVLMSLRLSRQLFRPIKRLQSAIGEVAQDNLEVQVQTGQDDELGMLTRRFNGMVAALKRSREQLVANERALTEAQLRLLQSQLNPHFLCNTLDTMKWISKIKQTPDVALMATDLAAILRFGLSPEQVVPLCQEVEILRRYVEIQSLRMSGRFTFDVALPPELADCRVPKMMLQPLAENAILHGLDETPDGQLSVRVWAASGGELRIAVSDNGRGIPPEMEGPYVCRAQDGRRHLGLFNVDTILKKYYGPAFGLILERRSPAPGTVVTAVLPLKKETR